jgi:hypothetical protein
MQLSPSKQNLFLGLSFSVLFIAIAKPLAQKQDSKFVKAERNPNQHRIVSTKAKTKANYKKPQTKPLSSYTLNLVKEFEGFSSQAYQDTDGTIVIGYGMPEIGGEKVKMGDRIILSTKILHKIPNREQTPKNDSDVLLVVLL